MFARKILCSSLSVLALLTASHSAHALLQCQQTQLQQIPIEEFKKFKARHTVPLKESDLEEAVLCGGLKASDFMQSKFARLLDSELVLVGGDQDCARTIQLTKDDTELSLDGGCTPLAGFGCLSSVDTGTRLFSDPRLRRDLSELSTDTLASILPDALPIELRVRASSCLRSLNTLLTEIVIDSASSPELVARYAKQDSNLEGIPHSTYKGRLRIRMTVDGEMLQVRTETLQLGKSDSQDPDEFERNNLSLKQVQTCIYQ